MTEPADDGTDPRVAAHPSCRGDGAQRLHGDKQLYAGGYGDAALDAWAPRERWPVRGSRA